MIKRLLIFVILFTTTHTFGSHIVGGEFELIYLSPNTYRLNLILYFDKLNGFETLLNQDVYAHIFRRSDNKLIQVNYLPKVGEENVPYYQEWCDSEEFQTLRLIYGDTITLSDEDFSDPEGYYVAWENCCRNYDVTNVQTGDLPSQNSDPFAGVFSGQTYYLEFPAVVKEGEPFINSSPSSFPALNSYACPNREYWSNFAGKDPDGDSLVYTLVSPRDILPDFEQDTTRNGPYPEVNWVSGFGPASVTGGDPDMKITKDGFLTVTPGFVGLFVFAVKVAEWRDGNLIGVIQREFQLYVDDLCEKTYPPVIKSKLATQSQYQDVTQLNVTFDNSLSKDDRCINIEIFDEDAEDVDEIVTIRAIPLNFDDEIQGILPTDTVHVLKDGNTASFDICFPDCPFIDPLENEVVEIGILVFDDSCPLPLMDTLIVEVRMEDPPNQNPYILLDGNQVSEYTRMVTEKAGGFISFPIEGFDEDNQELTMEIIPVNDFDPQIAGMTFAPIQAGPGQVSTTFSWNFDCTYELLDYSEGLDVSISPTSTLKMYDFLILVEDADNCEFSRADTVEMHLTIEFPGEASPNVFLLDGDINENYYSFDYDLNETIRLDVKALDGPEDSDPLNLFAIGNNFSLEATGASFPSILGGSGREPGTFSTFTWPLHCNKINLIEQDTFRTHFIATDIDLCNLANTDTLTIDFIIHAGENTNPELFIQNIAGEEPVISNALHTDISKRVRFNLVGNDPNNDSLVLRLNHVYGTKNLDNFEFQEIRGLGSINTTFSMDLGCEKLGDGFSEANYTFSFILEDQNCVRIGSDSLTFDLVISDIPVEDTEFLPANIFTPNGDGVNDFFGMSAYDELRNDRNILPLDNCIGQFESVSVINRNGKEVFFSTDRNFKWFAEGLPSGIYYYMLTYSNKVYKGTVTAMF